MEIQDIISSGLLELYAAGIASESEARQVEEWIALYPEVAAELKEIYLGMESYANIKAIQPSANVKDKIFARINEGQSGKIIPMQPEVNNGPVSIEKYPYWRMVAAASVVLLVAMFNAMLATSNTTEAAATILQ